MFLPICQRFLAFHGDWFYFAAISLSVKSVLSPSCVGSTRRFCKIEINLIDSCPTIPSWNFVLDGSILGNKSSAVHHQRIIATNSIHIHQSCFIVRGSDFHQTLARMKNTFAKWRSRNVENQFSPLKTMAR